MDNLWDVMLREMLQRYYAISVCNVQGIPMKDTGSKANYDVQLACKGVSIDISQDLDTINSFLNVKWHRAEPKKNVEQFYMTKSVHRVTPLYPYTMPTLCLMKHLASGKPVTLSMESEYYDRFGIEVTHLLLQHGSDVYLHVLHPSRMFYPWLTIPRASNHEENGLHSSKPPYRLLEFEEAVRNNMLRSNVPTNAVIAHHEQRGTLQSITNDEVAITSETRGQIFTLMRHNGFYYEMPTSIERYTRMFPLCADEESILFSNTNHIMYPTLYDKIIHPLWEYAVKKLPQELTPDDIKEVTAILTKFYQAAQKNETTLIPEIQDHTKRFIAYKNLWSEIRKLLIAQKHSDELLVIMDKKWPQFFFDKGEPVKNQDQRKTKRLVEVQRDRYGEVIFPISLGALTIHSIGQVVYDRPNYHTDKYIWPVGYKATRYYTSVKDTNNRCLYTCEIHDGGENPIFVLTSEDNPDQPIKQSSATAAWTVIVKKVNEIKTEEAGKKVFTNVSGPEYYGLAHPTVMKLISELPNAEKCIRPNAPHQPASKSVVTSNEDSDEEEREEIIPKPDTAVTGTSTVTPVDPVSPTSPNQSNGAGFIIARRQARDKKALAEAEQTKLKMKNIGWKKNVSLLNLFHSRQDVLNVDVPNLDGREEGVDGLYKYIDKRQMELPQQSPQDPISEREPRERDRDVSQEQKRDYDKNKSYKSSSVPSSSTSSSSSTPNSKNKRSTKKASSKKRKAPSSSVSQPPLKVPKGDRDSRNN
jgi:hypothetical protein